MEATSSLNEALGLSTPWSVRRSEFSAAERSLIVDLSFDVGGVFPCGSCGEQGCKAYDTAKKEWRHLDFLQQRTYIRAPTPRVECPACGVRQAAIPWARPRSAYTLAFEFRVAELLALKTLEDVAVLLEEPASRIQRVVRHHAKAGGRD